MGVFVIMYTVGFYCTRSTYLQQNLQNNVILHRVTCNILLMFIIRNSHSLVVTLYISNCIKRYLILLSDVMSIIAVICTNF